MSTHSEKLELIQWLTNLTDNTILEKIKWLKEDEKEANNWWNDLMEEERLSIERGLIDIKEGRFTEHEEVKKTYEKWL